jgi:hypothetical protein
MESFPISVCGWHERGVIKERDFRRALESLNGFRGWKQAIGSHVKAVFETGDAEHRRKR